MLTMVKPSLPWKIMVFVNYNGNFFQTMVKRWWTWSKPLLYHHHRKPWFLWTTMDFLKPCSNDGDQIKGEVQSWFNLISEERVKFSEQNSENLMKIGWKIRKLWNFEVSQIFKKHFLTSRFTLGSSRYFTVIFQISFVSPLSLSHGQSSPTYI